MSSFFLLSRLQLFHVGLELLERYQVPELQAPGVEQRYHVPLGFHVEQFVQVRPHRYDRLLLAVVLSNYIAVPDGVPVRLVFLELDYVIGRYQLALVYESFICIDFVREGRRGWHQDVGDTAFSHFFVFFRRLDVVDHAALGFELEDAERLRYVGKGAKDVSRFLKGIPKKEDLSSFFRASDQVFQLVDQRIQDVERVLLAFLALEFVYRDIVSHVGVVQEVFVEYRSFVVVEGRQGVHSSHQFLLEYLGPAVLVRLGSLRDFVYVVAAGYEVQIVLSPQVRVYELLGVVLQ